MWAVAYDNSYSLIPFVIEFLHSENVLLRSVDNCKCFRHSGKIVDYVHCLV